MGLNFVNNNYYHFHIITAFALLFYLLQAKILIVHGLYIFKKEFFI